MQHPEEGIIHAWLDGALPANEAAALEAHVASCDACSALVAEARGLIAGASRIVGHLDVVPANVIPVIPPARKRVYLMRSAWPAAIAASLIIGIGFYASRGSEGVSELSNAVSPEPSSAVSAQPATPMSIGPQVEASATTGRRSEAPVEPMAAVRAQESALDLPPVGATAQKASVAPAPPTVSPLASAGVAAAAPAAATGAVAANDARSEVRADSARLQRARVGGRGGGGRGGGAVGGTARSAIPATAQAQVARDFAMVDQASAEAIRAAVGCYELNASTDVLPARFALTADSAAVPGLLSIRYLDAEDRLAPPIVDLGWVPAGGSITIRNAAGVHLLTMVKTASGVTGESPNGQRNGRVLSCR